MFCPNWVGDVVMATPALRAIRRHLPHHHIRYVLRPYVADVLDGAPWFDELVLDRRARPGDVLHLARRLRRSPADVTVLLTNSFRSALAARLGGARRVVGYARDRRSWLLTDRLQPLRDGRRFVPTPVLDYYLELAYHLGCPVESVRMELFTRPRDEQAAVRVWRRLGLADAPRVVGLNPGGAFGAGKNWPTEHFVALADRFVREWDASVLVLCGPNERDTARRIQAQCRSDRVGTLADEAVSLGLSKACVRRLDLLVTTDSGPRHFAACFDVPVVTLFGPTHIAWTETYYPRAVHVQHRLECGPCQQPTCALGHHRCMRDLGPDEVFDAASALLERCR